MLIYIYTLYLHRRRNEPPTKNTITMINSRKNTLILTSFILIFLIVGIIALKYNTFLPIGVFTVISLMAVVILPNE